MAGEEVSKDSSYYCKRLTIFLSVFFGVTIIFIILPLLLGLAVSTLSPLEYGIEVDGNSNQVNPNILYSGGRYFLGLGHYFLKFPKYSQYILLSDNNITYGIGGADQTVLSSSVKARTLEGMPVMIDFAADYILGTQKNSNQLLIQLLSIYTYNGNNWQNLAIKISTSVILSVISKYSSSDLYAYRSQIESTIFDQLKYEFAAKSLTLNSALLINIEFPSVFKESVEMQEIINQVILAKQNELISSQIISQTKILNCTIEAQILQYEANNQAQEIATVKNSLSNNIINKYNNYFQALYYFKNKLGFKDRTGKSSASQLLAYFWLKVNQNNANAINNLDLPQGLKEN